MSVARLLRSLREESRLWRRERSRGGVRHATLRRVRERLGVEDLERRAAVLAQQLADERASLRSQVGQLHVQLDELRGPLGNRIDAFVAEQRGLEARIAEHEHRQQVWWVMEYVRAADVDEKTLVSVVMATQNRNDYYLPRAIESVRAQTYPRWELLIVDDGSDEAPDALAGIEDERIRCFRTEHQGLAAARNHALTDVRGELVTYLDDDNLMHPEWLRSVVWALAERPDVDVLYGAMIIDDALRAERLGAGGLPELTFIPFATERLAAGNVADIGQVAHRSGLADARFDEDLELFEDWDLLARLTRDKQPFELPVIAGIYTTSAPGRLMARPQAEVDAATEHLRSRLEDQVP